MKFMAEQKQYQKFKNSSKSEIHGMAKNLQHVSKIIANLKFMVWRNVFKKTERNVDKNI